jgi:ATP-dependent DNA ligase
VLEVPLYFRRELLHKIFEVIEIGPIGLSENIETAPSDMIRIVKEFGFEGIVAKRKDSVYEPGKRSGAWVKYRVNRGQEFVIGGYVPSDPFESLIVGYYEGDKLIYVAKVRNGFIPRIRREVARRFKCLEIPDCPFANLPEKKRTMWALTKEEMKNCRWLKPKLVAQIEFAEWTPDGHLRHSKFVGLREDKKASEVVREQ